METITFTPQEAFNVQFLLRDFFTFDKNKAYRLIKTDKTIHISMLEIFKAYEIVEHFSKRVTIGYNEHNKNTHHVSILSNCLKDSGIMGITSGSKVGTMKMALIIFASEYKSVISQMEGYDEALETARTFVAGHIGGGHKIESYKLKHFENVEKYNEFVLQTNLVGIGEKNFRLTEFEYNLLKPLMK